MKRNITIEPCQDCECAEVGVYQNKRGKWFVECFYCTATSKLHKSKRGAIVAWNLGEVYGDD